MMGNINNYKKLYYHYFLHFTKNVKILKFFNFFLKKLTKSIIKKNYDKKKQKNLKNNIINGKMKY